MNTRRLAGWAAPVALNGTGDGDRVHVRCALGAKRVVEVAKKRLQPYGLERRGRFIEQRRHERALSRLDVSAHAQPPGLDGIRRRRRIALERDQIVAAADRRQQEAGAVERQLHLVGILETANRTEIGAPHAHLKLVVAVERERVRGQETAHRPERHAVELAALRSILPHRVGGAAGADAWIADRDRADLPCRREVGLQQRGRRPLGIGDVVEAEGRRVRRQQRRNVDVEPEQIADGVGVLGPVQPVQRRPAGIGSHGRRGIELSLQRGGERVEHGAVGPACALWRHHAQPQLADHALPDVGVLRDRGEIGALEAEAARTRAVVVTTDAIVLNRLGVRARGRRGHGRRRLRPHP